MSILGEPGGPEKAATPKKKRRMKKQTRSLIIIAVVVVLMAGALVVLQMLPESDGGDTTTSSATTTVPLFEAAAETVQKIEIKKPDGEFTLMMGDTVTLLGYEDVPLSASRAGAVLNAAGKVSYTTKVDIGGAPLTDYGLGEGSTIFTVTLADGTVHAFELGAKNPLGTGYYGRVSGDETVYIFPTSPIYRIADATAASLVELSIMPTVDEQEPKVTFIDIVNGDKSVTIEQAPDIARYSLNTFMLSAPVEYPTNDERVYDGVIDMVSGLTAGEVYSLDVPADLDEQFPIKFVITIDGATHTLRFSEELGGVRLCVKEGVPVVYSLEASACAFLDKGFADLASSMFIIKFIDTFKTMTLTTPDKTYVFEAEGDMDNLVIALNGQVLEDIKSFRSFYTSFLGLTRQDEAADPGAGVTPLMSVSFLNRDGTTELYEYVPIDQRRCYVRANGEGYFDMLTKNVDVVIENAAKLERGEQVK